MPVEHSWLLPLMKVQPWEMEKVDLNLMNWAYSLSEKEGVRIALKNWAPNLLEWQAIEAWKEKHPWAYGVLPEVTNPEDALWVANADQNFTLSEEEKKEALELFQKIQDGELKPEVQTLLP